MITLPFIIHQRLLQQGIIASKFTTPYEVVKWLGAVQAQDYLGALWGVGLRMNSSSETMIEKALADRTIVRSWPMRGTLHFVASEDLRWMLKLLTPRVMARSAGLYKQAELDRATFTKSAKLFAHALAGGKQLTREEMYEVLETARISTAGQRGLHILGHLAQQGLLCFGTRSGKQHRFTLLDEWLPVSKEPDHDEALGQLALRYFTSHGPATLPDFVWWSGLTVADAKTGLEIVGNQLEHLTLETNHYWMTTNVANVRKASSTYLLPAYDEYTVAYKDRSPILDPKDASRVRNGIFGPVIIADGQIAGTWKRIIKKSDVEIETTLLPSHKNVKGVSSVIKRYAKFIGKD